MAGTVTGEDAKVLITVHGAGAAPSFSYNHSYWGIGDFSLTVDRGTIEQNLVGEDGNYFDQGALSLDGSLTAIKFGASGMSQMLNNIIEASDSYQYLAISGTVCSTDATLNHISWYLTSCQVTGYDISIGDADTITEASIDFTVINPFKVSYAGGCIKDA